MTMAEIYNGFVSRHLNRRLSVPAARALGHTPVTPNQVSVASLGTALLSFVLFAQGYNIAGGLLAQVSSVIDGMDGDLARIKRMTSSFGGFLDAILDRYADCLILLGMIIWSADSGDGGLAWTVGFWAMAGTLVVSYTRARVQGMPQRMFDRGVASLASRDVRLFLVMIGALIGQGLATLVVIATLTHGVVLLRLYLARKAMAEDGSRGAGDKPEKLLEG